MKRLESTTDNRYGDGVWEIGSLLLIIAVVVLLGYCFGP